MLFLALTSNGMRYSFFLTLQGAVIDALSPSMVLNLGLKSGLTLILVRSAHRLPLSSGGVIQFHRCCSIFSN